MTTFDPDRYGPLVAGLLEPPRLCELGPGTPNEDAHPALRDLDEQSVFPDAEVLDGGMAQCCIAALWLHHGFLDESHAISQNIATPSGSFWHGIMHRREGDFSNAKYWFRRVGDHKVFAELAGDSAELAQEANSEDAAETAFLAGGEWDPYRFIDLCQAAVTGRSSRGQLCRRIQARGWERLFDYCYRQATGAE